MKIWMIVVVIFLVLGTGFFLLGNQEEVVSNENPESNKGNNSNSSLLNDVQQKEKVEWWFDFDNKLWKVKGTPPSCQEPLLFPSPADINLASGVLYPGQVRGGDYKPHGGIRFDGLENNEVDVYAPMNGNLVKAARHLESGEVQYSLYFINDCGIMYKLDHLRELTAKFDEILNTIPMGGEGDSRTTQINPSVFVEKGELVATKIGFENFPGGKDGRNIFLDFGVYDLRKENGVVYSSEFRAQYPNINEYGTYALCWLDYLEEEDKTIAKSLPGTDGVSGKTSDYCD